MCQTVSVNRKWRVGSITTGGVLAIGTVAVAAGVAHSDLSIIALKVLWGGWLAYNLLWVALTSLHLLSLPDVCPCEPPQHASAAFVRLHWGQACWSGPPLVATS